MRRRRICQECEFENKNKRVQRKLCKSVSSLRQILVRRAGREKEKCTRMCHKEAQGDSGGTKREARLIRSSAFVMTSGFALCA